MKKHYLVACTSKKLGHPAQAKDLYCSPWFRAARALVESTGAPWSILSAQHGIVEPERKLSPYDRTVGDMCRQMRANWGSRVAGSIRGLVPVGHTLVVLAGRRYVDILADRHLFTVDVPGVNVRGYRAEFPLAGLGIGQQIATLKRMRLDLEAASA